MAQTEHIEAFRRFQAAREIAGAATDPAYDSTSGTFIPSSGTAVVAEPTESESADWVVRCVPVREYDKAFDVTASSTFIVIRSIGGPGETWDSFDALYLVESPAQNAVSDAKGSEREGSADELQAIIEYARRRGQKELADALGNQKLRPLDEDETPIQAASALCLVEYCIARGKRVRPLITVTPSGELDATWKGPKTETVIMRFFPNKSVWVAFDLAIQKGSFEAAATDLLNPNLRFRIPNWA